MRALVIQPLSLLPVKQGGKNGWALPDCRGHYWLIHVKKSIYENRGQSQISEENMY